MTIAAADVKPADTGPDIKSIKNPKKKHDNTVRVTKKFQLKHVNANK